jgi:hypothetical protein
MFRYAWTEFSHLFEGPSGWKGEGAESEIGRGGALCGHGAWLGVRLDWSRKGCALRDPVLSRMA